MSEWKAIHFYTFSIFFHFCLQTNQFTEFCVFPIGILPRLCCLLTDVECVGDAYYLHASTLRFPSQQQRVGLIVHFLEIHWFFPFISTQMTQMLPSFLLPFSRRGNNISERLNDSPKSTMAIELLHHVSKYVSLTPRAWYQRFPTISSNTRFLLATDWIGSAERSNILPRLPCS